jgi:MFS family permease
VTAPHPAAPPIPRRAFGALRHRNFRLFLGGQFVSLCGTWMQSLALGWLVLEITNSAALVGLVTALGAAPILAFTLYGGVIADRVNKRRALMLLQTGMLLDAALLGTLTVLGQVTPAWIMALAVVHGTLAAFEIPIRQAFLMDLVGRDDLMNAIALNSSAFNLSRVFGPALAGGVLATLGAAACFYINAASFLAVLWGLSQIVVPGGGAPQRDRPRARLADGLAYVRGNPWARTLVAVTATVGIFGSALVALLPVYARDVLGTGAGGYGGLSAAFGVGAASGALLVAWVGHRLARGPVALGAAAGLGLGLALIALSRFYPVSLLLLVVTGLAMALNAIMTNSTLQLEAPDHLRGQVVGIYAMIVVGIAPLGALPAGWLADRIGLAAVMGISGLTVLLAAAAGFVARRGKAEVAV